MSGNRSKYIFLNCFISQIYKYTGSLHGNEALRHEEKKRKRKGGSKIRSYRRKSNAGTNRDTEESGAQTTIWQTS